MNLSLNVFSAKDSPVYFVKGTHLPPLQNSKIVFTFFGIFNIVISIKNN